MDQERRGMEEREIKGEPGGNGVELEPLHPAHGVLVLRTSGGVLVTFLTAMTE